MTLHTAISWLIFFVQNEFSFNKTWKHVHFGNRLSMDCKNGAGDSHPITGLEFCNLVSRSKQGALLAYAGIKLDTARFDSLWSTEGLNPRTPPSFINCPAVCAAG